ncbi:MAG: hypothetical protein VYD64_04645 [Pseudomonadota bacterium]|nr:hypothetical protein [Pseudomonadota bacterium]
MSDASTRLERLRRNNRDWARKQATQPRRDSGGGWTRQSWTLPRAEARAKAREFLDAYPRAAYASEVESWRVLPGDMIEFTMRRLPSAD